mgnify:FL=1
MFIFLADIVNVPLQSFLIIAKETIKTHALILTNVVTTEVVTMVCVQNTMVEQEEKSICFKFFYTKSITS